MKNFILFGLLCIAAAGFAGKTDTTFQQHQISFSLTNAMSHEFLSDPSSRPTVNNTQTNESIGGPIMSTFKFLPNYTLHLHINYSLGLSKLLRIETGISYLLEGVTQKCNYTQDISSVEFAHGSFDLYFFRGNFTIPIHVKFTKQIGKGAFTCTLGPNLTLPIHTFQKETDISFAGQNHPDISSHQIYNSQTIAYQSSLGFDLKMGYEKSLTKELSINVGPVVYFSNLIVLDKNLADYYTSTQYRPYQYYIGFDVALNFEIGKKH